jgi:hypothetical protein
VELPRGRILRPIVFVVAMLGLGTGALWLGGATATPVHAITPALTTADSIAVVRGGIASQLVPGESVAVAGDVAATIAIRAVPQTRYARTLVVTLADSAGGVDGGVVQVNAHMRFMDHGAFAARAVAESGGRYAVAMPFAMPGEWELVVAFQAGVKSGEVVLDITVLD